MILAKSPQALTDSNNSSSATSAGEDAAARMLGLGDALFRRCANLLSSDGASFSGAKKPMKPSLHLSGRSTSAKCLAAAGADRVKGDMTPARGMALVRSAKFRRTEPVAPRTGWCATDFAAPHRTWLMGDRGVSRRC